MRWKLSVFGSFKVASLDNPKKSPSFERKTRAILAYLAINKENLHRRTLWQLFFQSAKNPAASLRWHLSRIRQALGNDVLLLESKMVALNTAVLQIDFAQFQQQVGKPAQQPLDQLVQGIYLFQGSLLEGLSLKNAPEFELWLLSERARTERLFENSATVLIQRLIEHNSFEKALPVAQKLLQFNSLLETAHHQTIWLQAHLGQREAALQQYEACQKLLQDELAVTPSLDLQNLNSAILKNAPLPTLHSPQSSTDDQRPFISEATVFIGRTAELQRLEQFWNTLKPGKPSIVFIEAFAGEGKTTFVQQFLQRTVHGKRPFTSHCYESSSSIPYQPWLTILETWVADADEQNLKQIPSIWQHQLGRLLPHLFSQADSASEEQEHLFRAIATLFSKTIKIPALLFIDDLHWADDASLQLLQFLVNQQFQQPIMFIGTYRQEELSKGSLLHSIVEQNNQNRAGLKLSLTSLNETEIDHLVRETLHHKGVANLSNKLYLETGGNPLFVTELLVELNQRAELPNKLPIPPSLQALTNHRLKQLPSSSYQFIESLAVLDRPTHFLQAQQISGRSENETIAAIEDGIKWNFLSPHPSAQYDFSHQLIRQAILQQMSPIRRQRLHYRAAKILTQHQYDPATLVYHWEMAGETAQTAVFCLKAGDQARDRAAMQEAITFYKKALAHFEPKEYTCRFEATLGLVRAFGAISDLAPLKRYLEELEIAAIKVDQPLAYAQTAVYHARHAFKHDETERAIQAAAEGMEWANQADDASVKAKLLIIFASIDDKRGNFAVAHEKVDEALTIYQQVTDKKGEAHALKLKAIILRHQGHLQESIPVLKQAQRLCQQIDDPFTESQLLANLGQVYWYLGEYEQVEQIANEGIRLSRLTGNRSMEPYHINNLAGMALRSFDYENAIGYYQQALTIAESLNMLTSVAVYNNNIAGAYVGMGEIDKALVYLETAVNVAQNAGARRIEALAFYTMGHAYRALSDHQQARSAFEKALLIREEMGATVQLFYSLNYLTETCLNLEEITDAQAYFAKTSTQFERVYEQLPTFAKRMHHYTAFRYHHVQNDAPTAKDSLQLAHQFLQAQLESLDKPAQARVLADKDVKNLVNAYKAFIT
ncbi:MAG: tetratricopeptide repeat protein [Chloroflexota bacterium]